MTKVDESKRELWVSKQEEAAERSGRRTLKGGDDGGTFETMDRRVTRLEVQFEQMDRTLASIDSKLDRVNERLVQLPTKTDLNSWKVQWAALALAVVAIVIGGIIGGLAWIQPTASPAPPTVIQMPSAKP